MKRLLPFAPLLLLGALFLSPAAALRGAKQGLDIWWTHVLPALLPSFICVKTAQELGLLRLDSNHPGGQLPMVLGFSLVSGAPNGARLLGAMAEDGSLSSKECERLLPLINGVSPAFLLSIIASELLKNKALFLPMAASFYGSVLILLLPQLRKKAPTVPHVFARGTKSAPFSEALSSAIGSGMLDMLRVGGCIAFTCTLLSLLRPIVPNECAYAALAGSMEVSTGVSAIADLSMPLRVKTSLLIGCAAFGGLSLALQTLCCYPGLRPVTYLAKKLLLGALTGGVCYLLFPLFPGVSPVFASRQEVLSRSLSLGSLLLSSALSVSFLGVLSLMVSPGKGGRSGQ